MGAGKAIRDGFVNYAVFRGRTTRSAFWPFVLLCVMVMLLSWGLNALVILGRVPTGLFWLGMAVRLTLLLPFLGAATRRLHDTGRSVAWLVVTCVYLIVVPIVAQRILIEVGTTGRFSDSEDTLLRMLQAGAWGVMLAMTVLFLLPGTKGPNRYGPDPRVQPT